ncbi:MAG TPA: serine hydrolase domain-containing protein [Caulobacteraceae bacterium]|nr:serine hydrolase domain-containing protein [Caulobacteraceae bacterium]
MDTAMTEQLDALFAPWNRTDEPGLAVGVARDGAVIYRRGFGMASLETAAAITPATRMRIGSTTKHFTALTALLLAEEGKLDIDQPIRAYVPELTGPGGEPSLRQLLQHRGGSRCYLDLGFIGHGMSIPPKGRALEMQVRQRGRNFAPGTAMLYNNGGYHLVSIAIERVGGAPFAEQLKTRLFDPVGMPDTALIESDMDITPGIAAMHMPVREGGWRRGIFASEEVRGEGGMVSTVDDMLRWMAHLRSRDRFGSPASWAELTALPPFPDGSPGTYGLGLLIDSYRGLKTLHHSGGVTGGSSQMLTLPDEGLDIIIMANGARAAEPPRLAQQVVDIILADRVGPEVPKVKPEEYPALVADWWSPDTGMIYSLTGRDGVLYLSPAKMPGGLPVVRKADGSLALPAGGNGETVIEPALKDGRLLVTFGGETLEHVRLTPDEADQTAFALVAKGRYVSTDADTIAAIEEDEDGLTLSLSDGLGRTQAPLRVLSPLVAYSRPAPPMNVFRTTISLAVEGGRATGFQLNTTRTRYLEFRRL